MSDQETNPALDKIIAEYLARTQAGNAPDRQELLEQHPELADQLKSFFANHDKMQAVAAPTSEEVTLLPTAAASEQPTIPPTRNASEAVKNGALSKDERKQLLCEGTGARPFVRMNE